MWIIWSACLEQEKILLGAGAKSATSSPAKPSANLKTTPAAYSPSHVTPPPATQTLHVEKKKKDSSPTYRAVI